MPKGAKRSYGGAVKKPARARANPKNMKKTTARGAYKKGAKKQMSKRLQPFVETKRRVHSHITALNASTVGVPSANYHDTLNGLTISNATAFTLLDLASYYRQSHGFQERNVIGDTIYSKWLKLKLTIKFPTGTNMIANPVKLYLITGWMTQPMGLTNNTATTEQLSTQAVLLAHIDEQIRQFFDEKADFLRFREKTSSNVTILSYRSLMPNNNAAIASPAAQTLKADGSVRTLGAVPDVNRSFTWTTKRKMHLSEGKATATGNDAPSPDTQNLYPNNQSLPFAIIYNKDFASMRNPANEDTTCTILYNDIHYFQDS